MAFMMPVVKNDWDIYKSNRSRKTSECNTSSTPGRARKISDIRSSEFQGMAQQGHKAFPKHHSLPDKMSSRGFSRPRTCSENLSGRARIMPQDRDVKQVSSSANNLKQPPSPEKTSWLEKIRKFVKQNKNEDERVQS